MNKLILIGNLTNEIQLKQAPNTFVANFSIATNRTYGEKEEVCFVECKAFGRTAENAHKYLKKGSKIAIEGRLVYESWLDKEGKRKNKLLCVVESLEFINTKRIDDDEVINNSKIEDVESISKRSYKAIDIDSIVSSDEIPF